MQIARILERIWHGLQKTVVLFVVLTFLLLLLLLTIALPQSPVSPADEAAFLRWLANIRTALGTRASVLAPLGLLSLRYSWWTRGVLVALTFVALARTARLFERWGRIRAFGRAVQIVILAGALLLLIGWGVQMRTGWIETGVSAWPEETTTLASHDLSLTLPEDPGWITLERYGLYLIREEMGLGLEISAEDENGTQLPLLTSAQGESEENLRLILTPQSSDAYFALPANRLIFRLTLQASPPDSQIRVQIYRGSGGELLTETTLQGRGTLFADNLRLQIEETPLSQLRVVYNPGAPLAAIGSGLLLLGALAEAGHHDGEGGVEHEREKEDAGIEETSEEAGA